MRLFWLLRLWVLLQKAPRASLINDEQKHCDWLEAGDLEQVATTLQLSR